MGKRVRQRERVTIRSIGSGPTAIAPAWNLLLDGFAAQLTIAHIDALPDTTWPSWAALPQDARDAQTLLHQRGAARGRGDATMGIELDPSAADELELLRRFGPYSIHCEAHSDTDELYLEAHDEGASCLATVSPTLATSFAASLDRRGIELTRHLEIVYE